MKIPAPSPSQAHCLSVRVRTLLCCGCWFACMALSAQPHFPYQGMNYVTFQRGQLPFANSWRAQDFFNSQAIERVQLTRSQACAGEGSLALSLHLIGQDANRSQGETFVDLRTHPPLAEDGSCPSAPFDFNGQELSARLAFPPALQGTPSAPNGAQLFVKDAQFRSYYGPWTNLIPGDSCLRVGVTPSTTSPAGGYMDPGFDPSQVIIMGLKIGSNSSWTGSFRGEVQLDELRREREGQTLYAFEQATNALTQLQELPMNTVSLVATWYMPTASSNRIEPDPQKSPSLSELAATIDSLHARGLKVMLKPHVDVLDGSWRGTITPTDPAQWFASYRGFLQDLTDMLADRPVELFCVGTEFSTLEAYEAEWRATVAELRLALPSGTRLTYAANWDAFLNTPFWDELDLIGIDAYFPLGGLDETGLDVLVGRWEVWKDFMRELSDSLQVPVLFTEIGYASHEAATRFPWQGCPDGGFCPYGPACELQGVAYEAAVRAFWPEAWFEGMLFWNWEPQTDAGGCCNRHFTPQNKPETLRRLRKPLAFDDSLALSCEQLAGQVDVLANDAGRGLRVVELLEVPTGWEAQLNGSLVELSTDQAREGRVGYVLANEAGYRDTAHVQLRITHPDRDGDMLADCVDVQDCGCEDLAEDVAEGFVQERVEGLQFRVYARQLDGRCDAFQWLLPDTTLTARAGDTLFHTFSTEPTEELCITAQRTELGSGTVCEQTQCLNTRVENLAEAAFQLFPNPGLGRVTIELGHHLPPRAYRLRVVDLQGRVRLRWAVGAGQRRLTASVDALANGLYLLQLYDEAGNWRGSQRFVKQP